MNSQLIVIVQVLIAVVFVLWIFSRRGGTPKPTVLNMTNDTSKAPEKSQAPQKQEPLANALSDVSPKYKLKKYDSPHLVDDIHVKAKVLNVIFMWNGHSWDAYEVFGLPAGSSIEQVRVRYNELHSKSDDGQRLFLKEAMQAIENKVSSA